MKKKSRSDIIKDQMFGVEREYIEVSELSNMALSPTPALLIKLGSIITHYEEFLSDKGNRVDLDTAQVLRKDQEVMDWFDKMNVLALLPLKR